MTENKLQTIKLFMPVYFLFFSPPFLWRETTEENHFSQVVTISWILYLFAFSARSFSLISCIFNVSLIMSKLRTNFVNVREKSLFFFKSSLFVVAAEQKRLKIIQLLFVLCQAKHQLALSSLNAKLIPFLKKSTRAGI